MSSSNETFATPFYEMAKAQADSYRTAYNEGYRQGFKEATEQALAILTKHFPQFEKPSEKPL